MCRTGADGKVVHMVPFGTVPSRLGGSADEAFALAREYPLEEMRIVQEGFKKDDLPAVQPCWPWRVMQPTSSLSRRN